MANLRDYDRDALLIEKVQYLEQQLADARESLDIAYAKGREDGAEGERLRTEHEVAPTPASVPDFRDAYQGAMEEVAIWKKRALEAEALNRKFIAEINGPTHMGEPSVPDGYQLVPVEPTEQMVAAMEKQWMCGANIDMAKREYKAALAAAPKPGDE